MPCPSASKEKAVLDLKAKGYESLAASIVECFNWHPEPQRLAKR